MPSLKPCPFCGANGNKVSPPTCRLETPYKETDRLYPSIFCKCGARMDGDNEDHRGDTAIAAWNQRAESRHKEALERIRDSDPGWTSAIALKAIATEALEVEG